MKNPQTTIAPTFLAHIISAIDGVHYQVCNFLFMVHGPIKKKVALK